MVFRSSRRVETNTNQVVIMTSEGWGWIWFGSRISEVEGGINPVEFDSASSNLFVDEFDGDSNMFDTSCCCVCFEGIDARLAVEVEWEWKDIRGGMSDVRVDILEIVCLFCCCEGTDDFAMC